MLMEQFGPPGNGTEAGSPSQGTGFLPKVVDEARAGGGRHQQEGRLNRSVKRDIGSPHKDEEDLAGNQRHHSTDGKEGYR